MKRVLVTGGAGTIGIPVIKRLIDAKNYEITALDLKTSKSVKKLKPYLELIDVVYGDINDEELMRDLVSNHDVIIHLAGVVPPFADLKKELSRIVVYEGTKNIVKSIKEYNPKCFLIYASTTCMYGNRKNCKLKVSDDIVIDADDNYASAKRKAEEVVEQELEHYTIFRLPAVLGSLYNGAPMYNIPHDSKIELISSRDASYAFTKAIEKEKELNKKIFNVTGGSEFTFNTRELLIKILSIHGVSARYFGTLLFVDHNFYGGIYSDSEKLEKILKYRTDTLDDYYKRVSKESKKLKRLIHRIIAKPFIWILKRKK